MNRSLILKFNLLIPGPTNNISAENGQSKSINGPRVVDRSHQHYFRTKVQLHNESKTFWKGLLSPRLELGISRVSGGRINQLSHESAFIFQIAAHRVVCEQF